MKRIKKVPDFKEEVCAIIERHFERKINYSEKLSNFADYICFFETIMDLEKEFFIEFSEDEIVAIYNDTFNGLIIRILNKFCSDIFE